MNGMQIKSIEIPMKNLTLTYFSFCLLQSKEYKSGGREWKRRKIVRFRN